MGFRYKTRNERTSAISGGKFIEVEGDSSIKTEGGYVKVFRMSF